MLDLLVSRLKFLLILIQKSFRFPEKKPIYCISDSHPFPKTSLSQNVAKNYRNPDQTKHISPENRFMEDLER